MWTERAIDAIKHRIEEQIVSLKNHIVECEIRISEDEKIIKIIQQIQEDNKKMTFEEWLAEKRKDE